VQSADGREITYNPERLSGVSVYREAEREFAGGKKERQHGNDGANREQEEGGEGRFPGRATELVRIDPELLARQRLQRGVRELSKRSKMNSSWLP